MKKSTKIMTAALGAVLAVSSVGLLGACGGGKKGDNVLKVAGLNGGYGKAYWEELEKGFEAANPGVDVQLTIESNIESTLRPQLLAGDAADVIYLATSRPEKLTELMINGKGLLDLTDLLDEKLYKEDVTLGERMISGLMGNGITNPYSAQADHHYMLPLWFSSNGLWYNANLFVERGTGTYTPITAAGKYTMPTTWDEFFALGDALKEARKTDSTTPYLFTYPTAGYFDTMMPASIASSAGTETVQKMFQYEPVWGDAKVTGILDNVDRLVAFANGYTHPNTVGQANSTGFKTNQGYIKQNKALFMPNGDWVIDEMKDYEAAAGFEWAVTPYLGATESAQRYSTVNVEQIYINKNGKNTELAKKFLLYVYSNEGLSKIAGNCNGGFVAAKTFVNYATEANGYNAGKVAGYQGYYDGSAQILAGSFAAAKVDGVDWNADLYSSSIDKLAAQNPTFTAASWKALLVKDAALLKAALK